MINHEWYKTLCWFIWWFRPLRFLSKNETNMLRWHSPMQVSWNRGTPKSSILIGVSLIKQPFWGTPIDGNPPHGATSGAALQFQLPLRGSLWCGQRSTQRLPSGWNVWRREVRKLSEAGWCWINGNIMEHPQVSISKYMSYYYAYMCYHIRMIPKVSLGHWTTKKTYLPFMAPLIPSFLWVSSGSRSCRRNC